MVISIALTGARSGAGGRFNSNEGKLRLKHTIAA